VQLNTKELSDHCILICLHSLYCHNCKDSTYLLKKQ